MLAERFWRIRSSFGRGEQGPRYSALTRTTLARLVIAFVAWGAAVAVSAQFDDSPFELEHPAIAYSMRPTTDVVNALHTRLQSGQVNLPYDETTGYLKPILEALNVSVDSQIVVFSKTSLQQRIIQPRNPRVIYFNDSVVVAWVRGGFIEIAAHDPAQGAVFYRVLRAAGGPPAMFRDNGCLQCHNSFATLGVPGFLAKSVPSAVDGSALPWLGNYLTDHRSPIDERWAGWFVTGKTGTSRHLGNAPVVDRNIADVKVEDANLNLADLGSRFDTGAYLSAHSDVVALLVFDHQLRMMNLLTRIGWEARRRAHEGRSETEIVSSLSDLAIATVDYMLFVDEAPLTGVTGSSRFAETFTARGPRDSQGRSLRDFDLKQRLFTHPCSYMIYSEAFERLPAQAKRAIYARMWDVLSGVVRTPKYSRLSAADRDRVIEILRDTKNDLPAAFSPRRSRP
jgi:hypothetical protein